MKENPVNSDTPEKIFEIEPGELIAEQTGILNGATSALDDSQNCDNVDPETVGTWITVVGKAIIAIFKP